MLTVGAACAMALLALWGMSRNDLTLLRKLLHPVAY